WDVCVAETVIVVTAVAATVAYLSTPSGQQALKAAAKLVDKALDAAAAGGNALAAGCAGSGTCLTGMKAPGGPPAYYQSDQQSNGSNQGNASNGQPSNSQPSNGNKGTSGGPRAGKPMTPKGKREVKAANAAKNNGQTTCERCGQPTVPAQ